MKLYRIPAKQLETGMKFTLLKSEYTITDAIENINGGMVVRFLKNTGTSNQSHRMVVPKNVKFKIQFA